MERRVVEVPGELLSARGLCASAKLIWMVAQVRAPGLELSATWLSRATGLARPTMRRGLANLELAGWGLGTGAGDDAAGGGGATAPVPVAVILDQRLGALARVAYGALLLVPSFRYSCGHFAFTELASHIGCTRKTLRAAVDELTQFEWIRIERTNRTSQTYFFLTFPGLSLGLDALAAAECRIGRALHYGEGLMREYLSLLVDSDEFEDDAAPGFLVRPITGERLQFDRFYQPYNVAFEFQGPQHFRPTQRFSAEKVALQRERDYVKRGICAERGIDLVTVLPRDLTLAGMRQRLPQVLPQRGDLSGYQILIDYLEAESDEYRDNVTRLYRGVSPDLG